MEKKWVLQEPVDSDLVKKFPKIPRLIMQLLHNRGLDTQEKIDDFLTPDYDQGLLDPFLFPDMEKAVKRIYQAIEKKEVITIHGDYDADGVTASAVLADVLAKLGADFNVYIPHREKEGYGLNEKTIKYLIKNKTNLIITVDCAVSNVKEVDLANQAGIDVIITDHHEEPLELPKAYAIIDPKVEKCQYPFKYLAGVGVAFKLAQAIISKNEDGVFPEGYEKWLLDLVALGTVADLMPLLGENRVLVKYGLIVLNKTQRIGLKLLADNAGIWPLTEDKLINSKQIGFVIGPRINAAGRMDHANVAYNLLVEEDKNEALRLTKLLEKNNQDRQKLTQKIIEKVRKEINKLQDDYIVLAEGSSWPLGIIGLAAARIKDEYNLPILIIARLGKKIAGSGRSIQEFNLVKALDQCSDYFEVYGGHAGAAGFTLKNKKYLKQFKEKMLEIAKAELKGKDLRSKINIEAELDLHDLDKQLYQNIEGFEPFGAANQKPVFIVKNLQVEGARTVGKDNSHLKLNLKHSNMVKSFEAIGFGMGDKVEQLKYGTKIEVVCEISLNEFNGKENLELMLIDIKVVAEDNKIDKKKLL